MILLLVEVRIEEMVAGCQLRIFLHLYVLSLKKTYKYLFLYGCNIWSVTLREENSEKLLRLMVRE